MTLVALAVVVVALATGHWWLNRPTGWYKQDNSDLFPIKENGKYGYMDRSGHTVIPPQFDDANPFSEGMAGVRIGDKFGYIDTKGVLAITPQFSAGLEFRYGRAPVKVCCGHMYDPHPNDRYGFIDSKGKYIGSPDYSWVGQFSGNRFSPLAPVQLDNGGVGFVDGSGKLAIPAKFESARFEGFTEGTAPVRSSGKWGYIDTSGKWVVEPQFANADNFAGGLASVQVSDKWGYIDSNGRFVINPQFDGAGYFSDGKTALVRTGANLRLIDRAGNPVGGGVFLSTFEKGSLDEGLRPVWVTQAWGFIDGNGKLVIPATFDSALPFLGGLAHVTIGGWDAYIDKSGTYVGDPFAGRSVIPNKPVQEFWEGDVINPSGSRMHERFFLRREGTQISGYYKPYYNENVLIEVKGETKQDGSFRIVSEGGELWKGQFLAPVVMSGVTPQGNVADEGKVPEFPFRLHFVRDAAADFPLPVAVNEASAVGSIRTISTAEVTFLTAYPTIGFSTSLEALGGSTPCVASSTTACLIDQALASGEKSGYRFTYEAQDMDGDRVMERYTVQAVPINPGTTGQRSFCSDQSGVIRYTISKPCNWESPPLQ